MWYDYNYVTKRQNRYSPPCYELLIQNYSFICRCTRPTCPFILQMFSCLSRCTRRTCPFLLQMYSCLGRCIRLTCPPSTSTVLLSRYSRCTRPTCLFLLQLYSCLGRCTCPLCPTCPFYSNVLMSRQMYPSNLSPNYFNCTHVQADVPVQPVSFYSKCT